MTWIDKGTKCTTRIDTERTLPNSYGFAVGEVTNEPMMSIDISRGRPEGKAMETGFEARWPEEGNAIAFHGKHLELAIPLEKLEIDDHKQLDVTLDEM
jgi:hypothetical protein